MPGCCLLPFSRRKSQPQPGVQTRLCDAPSFLVLRLAAVLAAPVGPWISLARRLAPSVGSLLPLLFSMPWPSLSRRQSVVPAQDVSCSVQNPKLSRQPDSPPSNSLRPLWFTRWDYPLGHPLGAPLGHITRCPPAVLKFPSSPPPSRPPGAWTPRPPSGQCYSATPPAPTFAPPAPSAHPAPSAASIPLPTSLIHPTAPPTVPLIHQRSTGLGRARQGLERGLYRGH